MSHLSAERLAALADEIPTPEEQAHLAVCAECARERLAYREFGTVAAASSAAIGAPLTTWEILAPALEAEGILVRKANRVWHRHNSSRGWRQAAAVLLFVAAGAVLGRYSAGATGIPRINTPNVVASQSPPPADSAIHFASVEQARAAQTQSQLMYQAATTFLAQTDSTGAAAADTPAAMRTRLAALDRVRETMGEALQQAPYDPVINGYYLTTLGQREATLRQLNTVLPEGVRITSY